jgi:hypothetical protein
MCVKCFLQMVVTKCEDVSLSYRLHARVSCREVASVSICPGLDRAHVSAMVFLRLACELEHLKAPHLEG